MKVKPWQMAVIVLGVLVGVGSLVWSLASADTVQINYDQHYVDVETGDIYVANTKKVFVGLPGRHPSTGRYTLLRLDKNASGDWYVNARDRAVATSLEKDIQIKAVDMKSGELTDPKRKPVGYVKTY